MAVTLKLKILTGKHSGREIEVKRSQFVIGRADDCDLRPASLEVSRRHCAFLLEADVARLKDLGGASGTLVNGAAVEGIRNLTNGDRIKVGPLEFEAVIGIAVQPQPSSAVAASRPSVIGASKMTAPLAPQSGAKPALASGAAEDDVMQWLTDAPEKPRPRYLKLEPAQPEPSASDTGEISLDATHPLAWPEAPQSSDPLPDSASRSALRRGTTTPKPPDPKDAGNTHDAAAAALDRFRTTSAINNRRPRE